MKNMTAIEIEEVKHGDIMSSVWIHNALVTAQKEGNTFSLKKCWNNLADEYNQYSSLDKDEVEEFANTIINLLLKKASF